MDECVSAPRVQCVSVDMGVAQNACCAGGPIGRHVSNIKSVIIITVPGWKLDKSMSYCNECPTSYILYFGILNWQWPVIRWMIQPLYTKPWGPFCWDRQIMWLVKKLEMVQIRFTLHHKGMADQRNLNEWKFAWHPTWHQVDNVSLSTGYYVRSIKSKWV